MAAWTCLLLAPARLSVRGQAACRASAVVGLQIGTGSVGLTRRLGCCPSPCQLSHYDNPCQSSCRTAPTYDAVRSERSTRCNAIPATGVISGKGRNRRFFHCRRVVCACSAGTVGSFSNKPLSQKKKKSRSTVCAEEKKRRRRRRFFFFAEEEEEQQQQQQQQQLMTHEVQTKRFRDLYGAWAEASIRSI